MEDISRELEREIAKSKPKPFRKNRKIKILIVDDFGKVISGNHMKAILMVLFLVSVMALLTSALLFYQYSNISREAAFAKDNLILVEKKNSELISEKEVLMARLVILGKEPGVKKTLEKNEKPSNNDIEEKKLTVSKLMDVKPMASDPSDNTDEEKLNPPKGSEKEITTGKPDIDPNTQASVEARNSIESKTIKKTISIEKFAVIRNKGEKDLLVRFDIRNISKDQGDVSGRIFTILKPDNESEDQWLVVPATGIKNGIPIENQKGQYFSIAHFKPVKFRIKSEMDPDFYKKASIFIFNGEGDLIFEKLIDITEAE